MSMMSPSNPDAAAELPSLRATRASLLDAIAQACRLRQAQSVARRLPRARRGRGTASIRQARRGTAGTDRDSCARLTALRRPGARRIDRRGRVIHARVLDDVAARRCRAAVRAQHGRARRVGGRVCVAVGAAAKDRARVPPQQPRRRAPQHRRALRPRQRFLPAVPRRDDDVFGRDVRASAAVAVRRPGRAARSHLPKARAQADGPSA